ncbi:MAG: amidohydrolase, partial [Firmicutes bacterium]|nr:amidohydrolase [Bacillota bacterium]
MNTNDVRRKAELLSSFMVSARRHLHKYPELSGEEYNTQKYLESFLKDEGVEYRKVANTGLVAIIHGCVGSGCVALRSDIDALPLEEETDVPYRSVNAGVMHACGHDAHTAIGMGAVKFFNDNRDSFRGAIKFFFQPAEEGLGGAKRMIEEGCMENPHVDYCLGLHVQPYLRYNQVQVKNGEMYASVDGMLITVKGVGGHGAYPNFCADTVVAAAYV